MSEGGKYKQRLASYLVNNKQCYINNTSLMQLKKAVHIKFETRCKQTLSFFDAEKDELILVEISLMRLKCVYTQFLARVLFI